MGQLRSTATLPIGGFAVGRARAQIISIGDAVVVVIVGRRRASEFVTIGAGGFVGALVLRIRNAIAIGIGQRATGLIDRATSRRIAALIQMALHAVAIAVTTIAAQVVAGRIAAAELVLQAAGGHEHMVTRGDAGQVHRELPRPLLAGGQLLQQAAVRAFGAHSRGDYITGIQPRPERATHAVGRVLGGAFAIGIGPVAGRARPRHGGLLTVAHLQPGVRIVHRPDDFGVGLGGE